MADELTGQASSYFDQSFWDELQKLDEADEWSHISTLTKQALTRPISSAELEYMLRNYAYLEIGDASVIEQALIDRDAVRFLKSSSGWTIHDHGSLLRASPGRMFYRSHLEDSGELGHGTVVQQFVDTARDMLTVAQARWLGARILGGYRPMQFAAYLIAQASHYVIEGIELAQEEARAYQYIKPYIKPIDRDMPEPDRMPR